jgi:hypothetical protein
MNISHQFNTRIGVNRQKAGLLDKSATIDLSVPANRAEVGRALDLEIAAQKEQIKNNDSVFPAWVRDGTRSASEMTDARDRLAWLTAAKQELKQYGDDQVMHQISFVSPVRAAFNLAASGTNSGSVAQNNNTNDLNNISAPARRLRQAPVLP